jgi:hypothetical protein
MRAILITLAAIISTSSMAEIAADSVSLKEFYFPYATFSEPVIYQYKDLNDSSNIQYWHMQIEVVNTDTILVTRAFNAQLEEIELFKEKIDDTGCHMLEFIMICGEDSIKTKNLETGVYKWYLSNFEKITWAVSYKSKYGDEFFSKTRQCWGVGEKKKFKGVSYPSAMFMDSYVSKVGANETSRTSRFQQFSYYAKGIGMIEYKRDISEEKVIHYYLEAILSAKEWGKLKGK